ncbi:hypothetical protein L218DRAFT_953768 [Marasmius fiardii PR-910]|nr:hypothetical protein L218DRAFT_953768 [Marasmius fiardii PR-910]
MVSKSFGWFGRPVASASSTTGEGHQGFQVSQRADKLSTTPPEPGDLPPPITQTKSRRSHKKEDVEEQSSGSAIWWRIARRLSKFRRDFKVASSSSRSTKLRARANFEASRESLDNIRHGSHCNGDEIDEVVVDRLWSQPTSVRSSAASVTASFRSTEAPGDDRESHLSLYNPASVVRWRIWHYIFHFFSPKFDDKRVEADFRREDWAQSKRLALVSSFFFIVNWVLGVAFIQTPVVLGDQIYYYGMSPILSVPLVVMCAYNCPRDQTASYQCFLCLSAWSWSFYQVIFAWLCGYAPDGEDVFTCGTKDFLATFYYTTALQTVALFGTNLMRLPALLGAVVFFILSTVLIIPSRDNWYRYVINFIAFECFILYVHYKREMNNRRNFELRLQLEAQFERTRKAQVNERKAADSKYRLTSYVFHEVRVPLNTALLAVQNMSASGTIAKSQEVEFNALEGSLSMMSKVLNDVLDFNRMDSGKFESLARPYAFHQVMRSMFIPLRLATDARRLELVTDLDFNIDEVARRAAYEFMGQDPETIDRHLKEQPSGTEHWGMVVGDETRLRQVVTNLASNACKFTPAGGRLTISTRLIQPNLRTQSDVSTGSELLSGCHHAEDEPADNSVSPQRLTTENLSRLSRQTNPSGPTERIVVRIEVTDTGSGIRPRDMAQSKLFSAFNQTEQGRQQGGKGTGLGLALVRLIVKLSGGRLGVRSKVGQGSTFWVELPLGVGAKAVLPPDELPPVLGGSGSLTKEAVCNELHKVASRASRTGRSVSNSVVELVDAASKVRATEATPIPLRSSSALHTLMDQGGTVALNLARYDSRSRVIGDPSTGTDIPSNDYTCQSSRHYEKNSTLGAPQCPCQPSSSSSSSSSAQDPALPRAIIPSPPPSPVPLGRAPSPSPSPPSSPPNPTITTTASARQPRPDHVSLPSFSTISSSDTMSTPTSTLVASPPPRTPPILFEALNVLVVDDDALTRMLMKRLLERLGCDVTTAENGDMALKILLNEDESNNEISEQPITESSNKFSCIFLDNQMPVMSGVETVVKLREVRGRRDFVVGVTGNALITDQREYLDAGADHVLTKPVLERSLKSMLYLADERRRNYLEAVHDAS